MTFNLKLDRDFAEEKFPWLVGKADLPALPAARVTGKMTAIERLKLKKAEEKRKKEERKRRAR